MKVTLDIKDHKYEHFIELVKRLEYVDEIVEIDDVGDSKEEIIENLTQSFKELKLIKEGKLKARPVEDLLDEL